MVSFCRLDWPALELNVCHQAGFELALATRESGPVFDTMSYALLNLLSKLSNSFLLPTLQPKSLDFLRLNLTNTC